VITNNVVVTDVWGGIAIYGVNGLQIINNTVLATNMSQPTWIQAGGTSHEGGISQNVLVRNNITTSIQRPSVGVLNLVTDHNVTGVSPQTLFVQFNTASGQYNLHLRPGTAAIGAGSTEGAPTVDIVGVKRTYPINPGAYQQVQSSAQPAAGGAW
jgi:hypothetical protein